MSVQDPDAAGIEGTDDLAHELRVTIGRMARELRSRYQFGLTQVTVLGSLQRDGSQSISQLAAAQRIRPQSMSQTLSEMEAEGLVRRSPDEHDGRRAKIDLTDAGLQALLADRAALENWLNQMLEQFTDQEKRTLASAVELMQRLIED